MTVLSYVHNTSKRHPAFETNRIATLRKYTKNDQWLLVDTKQSLADLFSKGVSPRQLRKSEKWFSSRKFRLEDELTWHSLGVGALVIFTAFTFLSLLQLQITKNLTMT